LNSGSLEKAQMMVADESPRTTKLYDRTSDQLSLDEVERADDIERFLFCGDGQLDAVVEVLKRWRGSYPASA
jgi:hypothetical protein